MPPHGFEPEEESHGRHRDKRAHSPWAVTVNPGAGHRVTAIAAAAGLNAAAASQGTAGLLVAAAVTVLGYVALVISAAIPEWLRLLALREWGRQLRWLVAHVSSIEDVRDLAALPFGAHTQVVRSIEATGTSRQAIPERTEHPNCN